MKESAAASHIRLDAAQRNVELWRNNSGGFKDENGRFVRFGLGSFNPRVEKCASSDWIGITPMLITPQHVGMVLGVFTAVETKHSTWRYNPNDEHTLHQQKFIDMVLKAGGYAGFAKDVADFRRIIHHD